MSERRMKTWTVDPMGDYGNDVQQVEARTAVEAAEAWAMERGHDPDDLPIVKVSAEGEPTRTIELSARVMWRGRVRRG